MSHLKIYACAFALISIAISQSEASQKYKDCSGEKQSTCFAPDNRPQDAFKMVYPQRTKISALLIHGLSDSPFYMKDIAQDLYKAGINVVAIKTRGHGTFAEDLQNATLENWKQDVHEGFLEALKYGDKVLISGFSTGGALAIHTALYYPETAGLILFSPAVKISRKLTPISCYSVVQYFKPWVSDSEEPEDIPVKYRKMATNGVCQLYRLTKEIAPHFEKIKVPVVSIVTEYDDLISPAAMLGFMNRIGSNFKRTVFYSKPESKFQKSNFDSSFNFIETEKIIHEETSVRDNQYIPSESNKLYFKAQEKINELLQVFLSR